MSVVKIIAITRPLEDALSLVQELQAQGMQAMPVPMLHIMHNDKAASQLSRAFESAVQAIAVTSKHALAAISQVTAARSVPLYAVGHATAKAAKQAGFEQVHEAAGNAQSLEALLLAQCSKERGAVLYLRGKDISHDLAGALTSQGFKAEEIVAYEAQLSEALPQDYQTALSSGNVGEVRFYSERSAANFVRLVKQAKLDAAHREINCVAMSEKIAKAAAGLAWAKVVITPYYHTTYTPQGWAILRNDAEMFTPAKHALMAPNEAVANAVTEEWRGQGVTLNKHAMTLTALCVVAIDVATHQREAMLADIVPYIETDLTCYRAGDVPELLAQQRSAYDPWLKWMKAEHDIALNPTDGMMPVSQPAEAATKLSAVIAHYDVWKLAAFALAVKLLGSAVLALALVEGKLAAAEAFRIAHLEEAYETSQWGADDEKDIALDAKRIELLAVENFLKLL